MKPCSICKINKVFDEYYLRDKRTGRLHSQCKACYSSYRRKNWSLYYNKHGSKYRENALARNKKLKNALRIKMVEYLSDKSCIKCGNNDYRVLEFDHIDPKTKSIGIAQALHNIWAWDRILNEIKKCQILCSNCHKIKTAEEQGWYKKPSNPEV